MPLYPVKNYKTGEEKELNLTISAYEKWREENPEWEKNWQEVHFGLPLPRLWWPTAWWSF